MTRLLAGALRARRRARDERQRSQLRALRAADTRRASRIRSNGIRQFVVGTGGRFLRPVSSTPEPNSEALDNTTFGASSTGRRSLHVVGLRVGVRPGDARRHSPTPAPLPATSTLARDRSALGLSRAASPPARWRRPPQRRAPRPPSGRSPSRGCALACWSPAPRRHGGGRVRARQPGLVGRLA